jgi:hypothetical protein
MSAMTHALNREHAKKFKSQQQSSAHDVADDANKRVKRNALCTCGSGRKYKKCCGNDKNKATQPAGQGAAVMQLVPIKGNSHTVKAMLSAGISDAEVYAYYNTADFICDESRNMKDDTQLAVWDKHITDFKAMPPEVAEAVIERISTGGSVNE